MNEQTQDQTSDVNTILAIIDNIQAMLDKTKESNSKLRRFEALLFADPEFQRTFAELDALVTKMEEEK